MTPKERAIQSFQENQNLISAINTLSIHIKLKIAGHSDLNTEEKIQKSREELCAFLKELNPQVQRAEVDNKPLLGVDPRRRQFVRHLVAAKHNSRISSPFLLNKLEESRQLLHSDVETDKQAILLFLEELRMLLEEHIASDTEILLGRI
ncbi:MAG: hypothetical protein OXN25_07585 [Candidatus Poribacteria bacterium]|nr:hypothetical protein [Candidatus Poribacteria bacterium]